MARPARREARRRCRCPASGSAALDQAPAPGPAGQRPDPQSGGRGDEASREGRRRSTIRQKGGRGDDQPASPRARARTRSSRAAAARTISSAPASTSLFPPPPRSTRSDRAPARAGLPGALVPGAIAPGRADNLGTLQPAEGRRPPRGPPTGSAGRGRRALALIEDRSAPPSRRRRRRARPRTEEGGPGEPSWRPSPRAPRRDHMRERACSDAAKCAAAAHGASADRTFSLRIHILLEYHIWPRPASRRRQSSTRPGTTGWVLYITKVFEAAFDRGFLGPKTSHMASLRPRGSSPRAPTSRTIVF